MRSGRTAARPTIRCYIELRTAATHRTIEDHVRAATLLGLAALLAIIWVVSFVIFHVAGWLIQILLLLALIFLLLQLFTGRPTKL
jgi:uncharacterized membrane protein